MARLIDADELIKLLKANTMSNGTIINTNTMVAIVEKSPTAYDSEKVVAELEEISEIHCKEYHKEEGSLYLQDAIKIVRKGGAE